MLDHVSRQNVQVYTVIVSRKEAVADVDLFFAENAIEYLLSINYKTTTATAILYHLKLQKR